MGCFINVDDEEEGPSIMSNKTHAPIVLTVDVSAWSNIYSQESERFFTTNRSMK